MSNPTNAYFREISKAKVPYITLNLYFLKFLSEKKSKEKKTYIFSCLESRKQILQPCCRQFGFYGSR